MSFDPERAAEISHFLKAAGWADAALNWLGQDASTRRYARLEKATGETALLMDAPHVESPACTPEMDGAKRAELGWNAQTRLAASRVDAFVLIADHLRQSGLRPPEILAHDAAAGFALIEDFGTGREFARLIEAGAAEVPFYVQAAKDLAHLHGQPKPSLLTHAELSWPVLEFDDIALRANADLYADWLHQYETKARMNAQDRLNWAKARDGLIAQAMAFPREFTLRDYHAENLLWLESENRVGVLDFQDAVIGWDAWDMAMLTQDARRTVSHDAASRAIDAYLEATGKDAAAFHERLAVIGTLNALRIAGVFARLVIRDGKPRYRDFMPRQLALLAENLKHPAAAEMRAFIAETAPFILETAP